jgi:hypothetical protein
MLTGLSSKTKGKSLKVVKEGRLEEVPARLEEVSLVEVAGC